MTKAHPATQNLPLRLQLQTENQRTEEQYHFRGCEYTKVLQAQSTFVLFHICLLEDMSSINNRVTSETTTKS